MIPSSASTPVAAASSAPTVSVESPWTALQAQSRRVEVRLAGESRIVTTYSPAKGIAGAHLSHFIVIQDKLATLITESAIKRCTGTPIYLINPLPELEELHTSYMQEAHAHDRNSNRKFKLLKNYIQMERNDWIAAAEKVFGLVREFIQEKRGTGGTIIFPDLNSLNDPHLDPRKLTGNFFTFLIGPNQKKYVEKWLQEYILESNVFYYKKMGLIKLGVASYSEEDKRILCSSSGADSTVASVGSLNNNNNNNPGDVSSTSSILPDAKTISCFMFALLKSKSPLAKEYFDSTSRSKFKLLSFWESKGYRQVDEPQGGDLVMYLNPDGKILHVGCVTPNLKIMSKPGDDHPYVYLHHVYDLMGLYQWNVIFVRHETEKSIAKMQND